MASAFFFVVVTMEILVGVILFFFTGVSVFPPWLWEILFSYYWFAALFSSMNKKYFGATQSAHPFIWDLKPFAAWLFVIHLISAYLLTFGILPWWNFSLFMRVLIAYPGSYAITFAIPIQIALVAYPRFLKKQKLPGSDPKAIQKLALQCELVQTFVGHFLEVRTFVCDHARKNQVATCFFAHRIPRSERPGLWEEAVVAVPVDINAQKALCKKVKVDRYLFQVEEERSTVFHLPVDDWLEAHSRPTPLEKDILDRFDTLFDRFPSMQEIPFPLALRQVPYERILERD